MSEVIIRAGQLRRYLVPVTCTSHGINPPRPGVIVFALDAESAGDKAIAKMTDKWWRYKKLKTRWATIGAAIET